MKNSKSKNQPKVRKNVQCLLVQTHTLARQSDGTLQMQTRHFFTQKKNFNYLIEFAKSFGANLIMVRAKRVTILPLNHIVCAFCDPFYNDTSEFTVLNDMTPGKGIASNHDTSPELDKIRSEFLRGRKVSVKSLMKKSELSESTIRRYLTIVRNDLCEEGRIIKKPSRGFYQLD